MCIYPWQLLKIKCLSVFLCAANLWDSSRIPRPLNPIFLADQCLRVQLVGVHLFLLPTASQGPYLLHCVLDRNEDGYPGCTSWTAVVFRELENSYPSLKYFLHVSEKGISYIRTCQAFLSYSQKNIKLLYPFKDKILSVLFPNKFTYLSHNCFFFKIIHTLIYLTSLHT